MDSKIKCPACGHEWGVSEEGGDIYEHGLHDVVCAECLKKFYVRTEISYRFEVEPC